MSDQCKAMNDTSYFLEVDEEDVDQYDDDDDDYDDDDDDCDPRYVEGKGILITQSARCRYVAQPGKPLCQKHQYMVDQKVEVVMAKVDE